MKSGGCEWQARWGHTRPIESVHETTSKELHGAMRNQDWREHDQLRSALIDESSERKQEAGNSYGRKQVAHDEETRDHEAREQVVRDQEARDREALEQAARDHDAEGPRGT